MNRSEEEFFHFYFQMPVKYQLKAAAEGEQLSITSNLFPSLTLNMNKYYCIKNQRQKFLWPFPLQSTQFNLYFKYVILRLLWKLRWHQSCKSSHARFVASKCLNIRLEVKTLISFEIPTIFFYLHYPKLVTHADLKWFT